MENIYRMSIILFFFVVQVEANVYYVSSQGGADFVTIQEGINAANAGDTVYVKEGTYHERIMLSHSGTETQAINITNFENDTVIIDGQGISWVENWGGLIDISDVSYISLSGFTVLNSKYAGIFVDTGHHIHIENMKTHNTFSSGIGIWYSDHVTLKNNEVSLACNDGGEESISIASSHHVTVTHNEVHHNGAGTNGGEGIDVKESSHDVIVSYNHVHHLNNRIGLYADAWDLHVYNVIFDSNRVHDCSNTGMAVASEMGGLTEHISFFNNLVYDNLDGGMAVGGWTADGATVSSNPVEHIRIVNNTFYHNTGSDGIYIGNADAKDIQIYNNIISNNDDSQLNIEYTPIAEVDIRNNLIDGVSIHYVQVGEVNANPRFIDSTHKNFQLRASSPAINRGLYYLPTRYDYTHVSRTKDNLWDIGAYEYVPFIQIENIGAILVPILHILLLD